MDNDDELRSSSVVLSQAVERCTEGRLALAELPGMGRCLTAAVPLSKGESFRDEALYVGSSRGVTLLRFLNFIGATVNAPTELASARYAADLDLAASIFEDLVMRGEETAQSAAAYSATAAKARILCRGPPGMAADPARHLHKLLLESGAPASRIPSWEDVQEVWRSVPLNWRRAAAPPCGGSVAVSAGAFPPGGVEASSVLPTLCSESFSGLFLLNSLLEHACRPNLSMHWERGSLNFVALRDIPAGCRVSMSYLDVEGLLLPGIERRKHLKDGWNFDCQCERCNDERSRDEISCASIGSGLLSKPRTPDFKEELTASRSHRWLTDFEGLFTEDGGLALTEQGAQRCSFTRLRASLEDAASEIIRAFACEEQTALQLRFHGAILGEAQEAEAFARSCAEVLGEDSEWTKAAQLLLASPCDFLQHVLRGVQLAANRSSWCGSVATASSALEAAVGNEDAARQALRRLYRDSLRATNSPVVLCGDEYLPKLCAQPICSAVVERVTSASVQGADESKLGSQPAKRVSRFRQQRQAQRNVPM